MLKDRILQAALDGQICVADAERLIKLINAQGAGCSSSGPLSISTNDPIEAARIYQQIMMGS